MANFNTHITAGAIASGLGATVALASGLSPTAELPTLLIAGTIGSTMPDMDLDSGEPLHFLFGVLGFGLSFGVALNLGGLPLWELVSIWFAIFIGVSFGLCHVFTHYTAHRGIWHSVLASALFAVLTTVTLSRVFGKAPTAAWMGGMFVMGGYILHLAIDEVYAINWRVWPWRAKKSLWTALKLYDYHHPRNSMTMAAVVLALLFLAPSPMPLVNAVHTAETHQHWAAK